MGVVGTDHSTFSYDLASLGKKMLAYIVDLFIVFLFMAMEVTVSFLPFPDNSFIRGLCAVVDNILLITVLGCFLLGDALPNGQTVGKRLMNISVVGFPVNTRCTVLQSFLRNVPKALFSVLDAFFVLFGFRRRLGDMLAMTMVINARKQSLAKKAG
ncbi:MULTISPECIES: RDD family protein [unclassified Pseudomonas]|uniref:RDD family protein n=1 Tax=unclassified Pseudomonas TaxID=196821 RepID=UPI000C2FC293|nr:MULTISPECIES: RDD family protein [unclassified Pseudomonas]MCU1737112.1 RDD family protein [Pseudomonas sp. 20S_6.2_Bac1]